jgi:hypothetical protein
LHLYTAECILKNININNNFNLLYKYGPNPTKLLTEYAAENINTLLPSQVNKKKKKRFNFKYIFIISLIINFEKQLV